MENLQTVVVPTSPPSMRMSDSVLKITDSLIKAQKKIKAAEMSGTGNFSNGYATISDVINAVKEPLLDNEIVILQFVSKTNVITRLQHSSGEFFENSIDLIYSKNDMQGLGSAITYARRYTLASMLNISQKDDDGTLAGQGKPTKPAAKTVTTKPVTAKDTQPF